MEGGSPKSESLPSTLCYDASNILGISWPLHSAAIQRGDAGSEPTDGPRR